MSWNEEDDLKSNAESDNTRSENARSENAAKASDKESSKPEVSKGEGAIYQLLENVLTENVRELKRARRWRIFFRLLFLVVLVGGFYYLSEETSSTNQQYSASGYVAVIPLEGVIGTGEEIQSDVFVDLLEDAYASEGLKSVVIRLNSPGGSPVHSGIIYDAIRQKQREYKQVPIYVVIEDMAASGGYYIASAADEIYADKASLIGSIGVISAGFNFTELLDKIGVERRIFSSGENKAFLDPFVPMKPEAQQKWQAVLDETHQQFIDAVKSGRGDRLIDNGDVFTGMVFSGRQSLALGLIDGLSSFNGLLNDKYAGVEVVYFRPYQEPWEEFAKSIGVEFMMALTQRLTLQ